MKRLALAAVASVSALCTSGATSSPVCAIYPNHITFHLNFDDGSAEPSIGDVKAGGQKPVIGDGGMFGSKGLHAGTVRYPMPKGQRIFDTTKPGTLVFWLKVSETPHPVLSDALDSAGKPVEIEPGETYFHGEWSQAKRMLVFKQGALKWGEAPIATYYHAPTQDGKNRSANVGLPCSLKGWNPGEWRMVAAKWRQDAISISINGSPFKTMDSGGVMGPFFGSIGFGLSPMKGEKTSNYVMDECTILDFGMSDEQVATLHRDYRDVMAGKPLRTKYDPEFEEPEWMRSPSRTVFRFAYYPYENTVHAYADISACDGFGKVRTLALSVEEKGGRVIAKRQFAVGRDGKADIIWSGLPELDGEYVCRLECAGLPEAKASQGFVRRRFEWERNRLGRSGVVPAPFTPVVRSGKRIGKKRVSVLLRDHTIGCHGLWEQVEAAGKPLLARPMQIVSDRKLPKVSAESEWDVDGMMTWRLKLPPGNYGKVRLEIPMRRERAWLFHPVADGLRSNFAGAIPQGSGMVWDSAKYPRNTIVGTYLPYVWLGGPLRGIAVFGENDRGWIVDGKTPCYEIVRRGDEVCLVLNIVQTPTRIDAARTVKIGFQATPVKPMRENWRAIDHGLLLGACYYWGGFWDSHSVEPYDQTDEFFRVMGESRRTGKFNKEFLERSVRDYPYPFEKGTKEYEDHVRRIRAHFNNGLANSASRGFKDAFVFYTNGRGVFYGDAKGQGATFCNEWSRWEFMDRDFTPLSRRAYDLDPVESYRDHAAWWYERMMSTGACDYLYWDDVFCQSSFNVVQTDAYRLPSGQIQPSSGIFNMRNIVKRCAVLQAEMGRDTRGNWVHMTNTAMAPILSFADVNYDWEDTSGVHPHQVKYPKDYILACSIGRQFGNRVGIMGYFAEPQGTNEERERKKAWLERTATGVMLTHEFRWRGHRQYDAAHKLLCDWGYRKPDVKVWNYWDEDVKFPVDVSGPDAATIAMARGGEAVIVVSSFSKEDGHVLLRPDCGVLGVASDFKAVDMETGKDIPVNGGVVDVPLGKYDFTMVKIR